MKKLSIIGAMFALLFGSVVPVFADVTVRSTQNVGGREFKNTTYIKGKRKRVETMDGTMITISQCDTHREIGINPSFKTYYSVVSDSDDRQLSSQSAIESRKTGGTVTITTSTIDTGERKQFFGYTARRVKSTIIYESSADACTVSNSKMETDGWYIDADFDTGCTTGAAAGSPGADIVRGCTDNVVTKVIGDARRGFAVFERTTIFDGAGRETSSFSNEVTEISGQDLDESLFEIPEGYSQVADRSELFRPPQVKDLESVRGQVAQTPASNIPVEEPGADTVGVKKPGTIRIGLARVKVAAATENLPAAELAEALRNTLADQLNRNNIEVVVLESELPSEAEPEARNLDCDAVLYAVATHKKGGGGFGGMFGKVIAPGLGNLGGAGAGNVASTVAVEATRAAIITAASVAAKIKDKDEISLTVELTGPGSASSVRKQYKRKARSNGEDIITPLMEEAAAATATLVKQRTSGQ